MARNGPEPSANRRRAILALAAALAAGGLYAASRWPPRVPAEPRPGGPPGAAAAAGPPRPRASPPPAAPAPAQAKGAEPSAGPAGPGAIAPGADRGDRELLRSSLARGLAERLPGRAFSSGDVDRMTDALLDLRAARAAVRACYRDAAAMRGLAAARAELERAAEEFERAAGMSPADLTAALEPEAGLTTPGSEHEAPVLEPISPP